jgi:hypothetical protein
MGAASVAGKAGAARLKSMGAASVAGKAGAARPKSFWGRRGRYYARALALVAELVDALG